MSLRHHDVVGCLVAGGLLDRRDLIGRAVTITDVSRNNRNALVAVDGVDRWFVKHSAAGFGGHEAFVLGALARAPRPLRDLVPACLHHDTDRGLLVLEARPGTIDLHRHVARTGQVSRRLAGAVGTALGRLHRWAVPAGVPPFAPGAGRALGCLQLAAVSPGYLARMGSAEVQLARAVHRARPLHQLLTTLRAAPGDALVHGDLWFPNVLVDGGRLRAVVDWELAARGDPALDLGSWWGGIAATWARRQGHAATFATCRQAVERSWRSYRRSADPPAPAHLARRAVRWTAARLVQDVLQNARGAQHLTAADHRVLQVAVNLAAATPGAAANLIGASTAAGADAATAR